MRSNKVADSLTEEILNEARENFINGNYRVAEPLLHQLILQNTRNPEVYQMLATTYYDRGQFNKAIKTFKRALEIDPTYTDASVGLSIILNDLGKYEEGKQVFEEAQKTLDRRSGKMDPYIEEKLAAKHEELADMYFQYKKYNEALEQLFKAQKLSSRKADISLRIADCHIQMGENDRAIRDLRSLIKEYPQLNQIKLKLGVLLYNLNNLAEATELWEAIIYRDPNHSEANRYLRMARTAGITSLSL